MLLEHLSYGDEIRESRLEILSQPRMVPVRFQLPPSHLADVPDAVKELILLLLAPKLINGGISDWAADILLPAGLSDEKIDAYANLNSKHVVGGSRQFRILAHVATQVEYINLVEVPFLGFSDSIQRTVVYEAAVRYERNDSLQPDAVSSPAYCLDVRVL